MLTSTCWCDFARMRQILYLLCVWMGPLSRAHHRLPIFRDRILKRRTPFEASSLRKSRLCERGLRKIDYDLLDLDSGGRFALK
jgi:hypothetical protein